MPPCLPLGFRFKPTDEELINSYLLKKVSGEQLESDAAVIEGEVYGVNAQLPEGNGTVEELYLFVKTKKNQKGTKTIRLAGKGYWKVTGNNKEIFDKSRNHIGTKRSLVFKGKSNSRTKKNLLMDEYSLTRSMIQNNSEAWVLCKIKQSNRSPERPYSQEEEEEEESDGLTPRPAASPALQGTDNKSNILVIDDMECFDMDDLLASTEDNPANAQCPLEPAGWPIHMWPDQPFDQSRAMMGTPTLTPTEPPTLGGIDYNWVNHNGCYNMNNGNLFNEAERSLEPAAGPSHMWSDQLFDQSMMGTPTPTPTPTEPQTLGGIYYNWVNHDACSNMNNENLFNVAECPLEPAAGPSHLWSDQFFDQSMMGTPTLAPTEPQTLGGNDYNGLNHDIYYPESQGKSKSLSGY